MGKCRSTWRRFPLTKLTKTFRRSPLLKKTLIIASVCAVYLIFVTSHFGSSSQDRTTAHDDDKSGHSRGLYHAGNSESIPVAAVAPTRPNVVYITLKSKRLKPANIRGTVRPKLRRKTKTHKTGTFAFTHGRGDSSERDANQTIALHTPWSDIKKLDYKHVDIPDNSPCPVVQWASSPPSPVHITWAQYQRSLKHKCWLKNISPKSDSDCSSIHHHEWSRLAMFDFLLQNHRRLDPQCCGFRPRLQDECGGSGCSRLEDMELEHLTHTEEDPRHLLFTHNTGFFDHNEDNLDFRLLEGITELPAAAVAVLQNGRLRERLLQSLFIDQTFWESQGGRQGIDKIIGVLEKRAQVLLTYINAHGITLTPIST
ncbi:Golgi-associated kinase 1B [Boleophthalmus pectinirostris]|uniref:Golgi-associated kinase 1B n=1 Tax=Boleophthalmus pectinirostris TaxID=150288 RepID=UPI00243109FC|nr:Golgi-associated kinase 1B [Boleophthalmus pectinirostris]